MTLKDLPIGKTATIRSVGGEGALRQHFLDMGLIPHGDVTMVKFAPMGDPMELRIHSYELTLRLADAEKIEIENVRDAVPLTPPERRAPVPHPGLGEGRSLPRKADRKSPARRHCTDLCPRRQSELRQDYAVQSADRLQPARRQLSPASPSTARTAASADRNPVRSSPTCPASIPCRRIPAKSL